MFILEKYLQAIICAGLYPNVAATEEGIVGSAVSTLKQNARTSSKGHAVWYDRRREVHIHPSSINHSFKNFQYPFLVFLEKVCFAIKLQTVLLMYFIIYTHTHIF